MSAKLSSDILRDRLKLSGLIDPSMDEHRPSFKVMMKNTVYDVLKLRGYREVKAEELPPTGEEVRFDSGEPWDLFWCDKEWIKEIFDKIHLRPWQKVNHFKTHPQLTRKDLLIRNLKRAKTVADRQLVAEPVHSDNFKRLLELWPIMPQSYLLPKEVGPVVSIYDFFLSTLCSLKTTNVTSQQHRGKWGVTGGS